MADAPVALAKRIADAIRIEWNTIVRPLDAESSVGVAVIERAAG